MLFGGKHRFFAFFSGCCGTVQLCQRCLSALATRHVVAPLRNRHASNQVASASRIPPTNRRTVAPATILVSTIYSGCRAADSGQTHPHDNNSAVRCVGRSDIGAIATGTPENVPVLWQYRGVSADTENCATAVSRDATQTVDLFTNIHRQTAQFLLPVQHL